MAYAYDEMYKRTSVEELNQHDGEGVLVYSGNARPFDQYVNWIRASGKKVVWIFESSVDRALAGYQAGVDDCRWHESRVPAGALSYVVACDLNDGLLRGRDVTAYLRGWSDTTREPVFGQYGSSTAIQQGKTVGRKLQRFWGVVNWIVGGGPNNAPQNIEYWKAQGVHLIQLIGSPIGDTDQNMILSPIWHTFAQEENEIVTEEQMNILGGWMQEQSGAVIKHVEATLGKWEWDTRTDINQHVDAVLTAFKAEVLAAVAASACNCK